MGDAHGTLALLRFYSPQEGEHQRHEETAKSHRKETAALNTRRVGKKVQGGIRRDTAKEALLLRRYEVA